MADTGATSPGTLASDSWIPGVVWTDPSNAASSNDTYTTSAVFFFQDFSQYLLATNFGFSIPGGATIDGVKVEIERSDAGIAGTCDDYSVVLWMPDPSASDYQTDTTWPTSDAYDVYGGSSDLWGEALTPAIVNATDFGCAVAVRWLTGDSAPRVDHIRMTVYYTAAAGGKPTHQMHYARMRNG